MAASATLREYDVQPANANVLAIVDFAMPIQTYTMPINIAVTDLPAPFDANDVADACALVIGLPVAVPT